MNDNDLGFSRYNLHYRAELNNLLFYIVIGGGIFISMAVLYFE